VLKASTQVEKDVEDVCVTGGTREEDSSSPSHRSFRDCRCHPSAVDTERPRDSHDASSRSISLIRWRNNSQKGTSLLRDRRSRAGNQWYCHIGKESPISTSLSLSTPSQESGRPLIEIKILLRLKTACISPDPCTVIFYGNSYCL
jgi:hypothetical protein